MCDRTRPRKDKDQWRITRHQLRVLHWYSGRTFRTEHQSRHASVGPELRTHHIHIFIRCSGRPRILLSLQERRSQAQCLVFGTGSYRNSHDGLSALDFRNPNAGNDGSVFGSSNQHPDAGSRPAGLPADLSRGPGKRKQHGYSMRCGLSIRSGRSHHLRNDTEEDHLESRQGENI